MREKMVGENHGKDICFTADTRINFVKKKKKFVINIWRFIIGWTVF